MAKKIKEIKNKYSLYLVAIVAIVAIVGIVVMVSTPKKMTTSEEVSAESEEEIDLAGQAISSAYYYGCKDPDSNLTYDKKQLFTKSITTYNGGSVEDYCYTHKKTGKTYLMEGICYSKGSFGTWQQNCAELNTALKEKGADYKCVDGTCVNVKDECVDSDGGQDIYVKGTTTGWTYYGDKIVKKTVTDGCITPLGNGKYSDNPFNGTQVLEYTCSLKDKSEIIAQNLECPSGKCVNGACVKEVISPTCTPGLTGKKKCELVNGYMMYKAEYQNADCTTKWNIIENCYASGNTCMDNVGCCKSKYISSKCIDANTWYNTTQNSCTGEIKEAITDCSKIKNYYTGQSQVCKTNNGSALCSDNCVPGETAYVCKDYFPPVYRKMICIDNTNFGYYYWGENYPISDTSTCPAGATCYNLNGKCQTTPSTPSNCTPQKVMKCKTDSYVINQTINPCTNEVVNDYSYDCTFNGSLPNGKCGVIYNNVYGCKYT